MLPKRQLAAIMFTDIEGYTNLMQRDEELAILLRDEHRKIFNTSTKQHGGRTLQYYGDGTLSIFDSAIAAVKCGIQMQRAFRSSPNLFEDKVGIPVRIGIHLGDIIHSEEEIIGDSVNIASRIESLATVGSVLISDKVYDEIKNQNFIETQSMGWFELKNVGNPMEVFAISNTGLVVPDASQIQGKARKVEKQGDANKSLWDRRQAQLVTGYFAGVWGLVEFTEWMLNRYQISPYWTDITLIFFLSLIPSLFLYVYNSDRIRQGKLKLLDKLFLPFNLVLSICIIALFFKGADLGATTRTVQYNNENGDEQFSTIVKSDFRKKLALHNFLPETTDSTHQWLRWGIHAGIAEDITQNGYMTIGFWNHSSSLPEMISLSKEEFFSHLLTGTYSVEGDTFKIITKFYKTQNGALKKTHAFHATDLFALIDTISAVTKKELGFTQTQIDQFVDLPFAEAFTSDIEAYKNYSLFFSMNKLKYLEQAISLDSTFALANYILAEYQYAWSLSNLGAEEAINQGMRHRKRLPESWRSKLKRLYFQINDQPDKAIALLKMQLEMNPGNQNFVASLTNYFYLTAQYKELLNWRKKLAEIDPGPGPKIGVAEALLLNAKFEEAGHILRDLLDQYPNQPDALTSMTSFYALTGQIEKADSLLQKIIVQNPEVESLTEQYSQAFQYVKNNLQTSENLIKYHGLYRLQSRPAEFDITSIKNLLFVKEKKSTGGSFFLPSGPKEFLVGNDQYLEKWTFVSDTTGRIYKIDAFRMERDRRTFNNVLWRQDSTIRKAMGLFSGGKEQEALTAFRTAYDQNPEHFYLAQYINHLEFVLNPEHQEALDNQRNFAGRYGPRHIWIENDRVYYRREGSVSKQQLLPISPDKFYFEGGFDYQMQVVVKNGDVQGTVSWKYDYSSGEFVRDDEDYFAFDKLED